MYFNIINVAGVLKVNYFIQGAVSVILYTTNNNATFLQGI